MTSEARGQEIWDTSSLTPQARDLVQQALDNCAFDWAFLKTGLLQGNQWSTPGKTSIPVRTRDLSAMSAEGADYHLLGIDENGVVAEENVKQVLGLFWFSGLVEVDQSLIGNPSLFKEVFLSEGAHASDFYYLLPNNLRPKLNAIYHPNGPDSHGYFEGPYFDMVGEAYMGGFVYASTGKPSTLLGFSHPTTATIATQIKELLHISEALPPPPEPPLPPQEPIDDYVIDISFHKLTAAQVEGLKAAGVKGVIQCLVAGTNPLQQPAYRVENLRLCQQGGMPAAGYVALHPASSGRYTVGLAVQGMPADLWKGLKFVAIDVEVQGTQFPQVASAVEEVARLGQQGTLIYTSYNAWVNYLGNPTHLPGWGLWNASWDNDPDVDYSKLPFGGWAINEVVGEQFSGGTNVAGVFCDQNVFRRGIFDTVTPPPPPPPPPPEPPSDLGHIQTITFDGQEGQVAFSGGQVWPITATSTSIRFIIKEP